MSRTIPYVCPHGAVLDRGDYGDDDSDDDETCRKCDAAFAALLNTEPA